MKMRIQLVIEGENGEREKVEEIMQLERGPLRPEELGLGFVALRRFDRASLMMSA